MLRTSGSEELSAAEQLAFFRECLKEVPVQRPKRQTALPAVMREWHPSTIPTSYPPAQILKRHPAFQWGLDDIPETKTRQAVRGANRGRFGKFSSQKMRRNVRARSDLEFDCLRWMEFDADVEAFLEQPVILRYQDEGRWRLHIPDLFVRRADSLDGFIEVKFEEMAARPKYEAKYAAIGRAVAALGYTYSVLTERHIRHQPAFSTLNTLFLRDRWTSLPGPEGCAVLERVLIDGPLPLTTVIMRAPEISIAQLRALILRGFLRIDLDRPLSDASLVQLTGRRLIRYQGAVA